jgi:hypothetical protein
MREFHACDYIPELRWRNGRQLALTDTKVGQMHFTVGVTKTWLSILAEPSWAGYAASAWLYEHTKF